MPGRTILLEVLSSLLHLFFFFFFSHLLETDFILGVSLDLTGCAVFRVVWHRFVCMLIRSTALLSLSISLTVLCCLPLRVLQGTWGSCTG